MNREDGDLRGSSDRQGIAAGRRHDLLLTVEVVAMRSLGSVCAAHRRTSSTSLSTDAWKMDGDRPAESCALYEP